MSNFLTSLYLFCILNTVMLSSESIRMKDAAAGRVFDVQVLAGGTEVAIKARSGLLFMEEYYVVKGDTFYLSARKFGLGAINMRFTYKPLRVRMILPLEDGKSWKYEGEERSFGYFRRIKSEGYVIRDSSGFAVFNITSREGSPDTSVLELDTLYSLKGMKIGLPGIPFVRKLIGTKEDYLILKRDE